MTNVKGGESGRDAKEPGEDLREKLKDVEELLRDIQGAEDGLNLG